MRKFLGIVAVFLSLGAMTASAALLGMNGFVRDESQGLDWLSLTDARIYSKNYLQVADQFNTTLFGWRYASSDELMTLMIQAGIPASMVEGTGYNTEIESFSQLFGNAAGLAGDQNQTYGFFPSIYGGIGPEGYPDYMMLIISDAQYCGGTTCILWDMQFGGAGTWLSGYAFSGGSSFLIRNSSDAPREEDQSQVPEPATLALVGFGVAGFGAIRRRKK